MQGRPNKLVGSILMGERYCRGIALLLIASVISQHVTTAPGLPGGDDETVLPLNLPSISTRLRQREPGCGLGLIC